MTDIVFPDVDLSHDEGDPRWHAAGGEFSTPIEGSSYYRWNGLEPGFWKKYWGYIKDDWAETVVQYEENPQDVHSAYYYVDGHPAFWVFSQEIITMVAGKRSDMGIIQARIQRMRGDRDDRPRNHLGNLVHEGAMQRGFPSIDPHKVNPVTRSVQGDENDTEIQWWYEFGPYPLNEENHSAPWHDYKLDGGSDTYENALIAMAGKIHRWYGNDRQVVDSDAWRNNEITYDE